MINQRIDESARALACTLISSGMQHETETERRILAHRAYDLARKLEQSRELFDSVERERMRVQEEAEREAEMEGRKEAVMEWLRKALTRLRLREAGLRP